MNKPSPWREIQKSNFTNWEKLADFLLLNEDARSCIKKHPRFSLNIPLRLAEKIQKGTLDDPILKQFLPTLEEDIQTVRCSVDPVKDVEFRRTSKLLHKYEGRALITATSACAMHCRYCFRQNFDYDSEKIGFLEELKVLRQDHSIREIILSGGDPLSLSNQALRILITDLGSISHIRRLRFHTRFPVGIPERIDDEFLDILAETRLQVWFIIHSNHPKELDDTVLAALKKIQKLGIPVLNQAVLLKGVNDSRLVLKALLEKLVDFGISPYYLHQLDVVRGANHFEVSEEEGRKLILAVSKELSGYAIPKYVKEIPGASGKTDFFIIS